VSHVFRNPVTNVSALLSSLDLWLPRFCSSAGNRR